MKQVGYILMAVGLALLAFVFYMYFRQNGEIVSPVPEEKGVKVIYITPGQED